MSKKDDEINRQLILNSGGADPEDYLTKPQLKRYNEGKDFGDFIDINVDLVQNTEQVDGILDEELGPDEDDEVAVSAYAANRAQLNASRNNDPNRFKEQMDAVKSIVDPSDPAFISEFMFDMATDASILMKSDNPIVAARIIAARRLAKRAMKDLPKPNFIKQIEAITSGNLFGLTGGGEGFIDPPPKVRKTPGPAERELRINKWVNDLAFTVDKVKRDGTIVPTHISKLQPKGSGYDLLGIAKAEWNQWAKRTGFIRELSDRKMTAYVEHLVGKDKYYDVFWGLPNHQRFRKGSRHGPDNVRILKDNRMKTFKDSSETILKKLLPKPTRQNILVFDYDIPRNINQSIIVSESPKDLMLKRADGTVVGRLGDYHDVLYAPYQELKKGLEGAINKRTGRPYITTKLPDGSPLPEADIKAQISIWRSSIIRDKIQFIIDEAPTLKGLSKRQKWQYQGSAIQDDMVKFLAEYEDVLKPAKRLMKQIKSDPEFGLRGGKSIKTQTERIADEVTEETKGIFMNKEQQLRIEKIKRRKGRFTSEDLDNILGKNRDVD